MNERWTYQVIDSKPDFLGRQTEPLQDTLNRHGAQGWELVEFIPGTLIPQRLIFKKPA
jgi:hypothetical protein